jgi:hypothetical protein
MYWRRLLARLDGSNMNLYTQRPFIGISLIQGKMKYAMRLEG